MTVYFRALAQFGTTRTPAGRTIAGGWCWFDHAERIKRGAPSCIVAIGDMPDDVVNAICAPRARVAGLGMDQPRLMGILNTTPDSFSDGGAYLDADNAVRHAHLMASNGADILDIGGESTRPGAAFVAPDVEIARTVPVIKSLAGKTETPISIDTRKGAVARAALDAGAAMINDVSALSFDTDLAKIAAKSNVSICLMHAQGGPETMQDDPRYDDVLLDVYDYLHERIQHAVAAGIAPNRIIVDPGIGFGKTPAHNLALIRGMSLFHSLGCPLLLGASRKKFIATLTGAGEAAARLPGTIAITLAGIAQGVQISRVHDIAEIRQALTMWNGASNVRAQ